MSSPRPTLEGTVAPEEPRSRCPSSGRTRCREAPQATCDRRHASPRSAHTASPRTPQKSKSQGARRQTFMLFKAFLLELLDWRTLGYLRKLTVGPVIWTSPHV